MSKTATPASLDYLREELPHIYHSNSIQLSDVQQAMDYYAPVFYGSKLSEVKGLPSEDDVNLLANKRDTIEAAESFIDCYAWLIPIAQQVIAKERESAESWKKEFDSQVHKCNAIQMELNKAKEEIDRLKGIIEMKDL